MASKWIFIKLALDIAFLFGALVICLSPVFVYMEDVKVNLTYITYNMSFVTISGSSDEICDTVSISSICDNLERFIIGGIIFLIFLILSCICLLLSLTSILTVGLRLDIKYLQLRCYHIFYPILYFIGFIVYILETNIYSLPDYGLGEDYQMKGKVGLYFMYVLVCLSCLSLVSYCTAKPFCICDRETPLLQ